jgi:hypothetical protein
MDPRAFLTYATSIANVPAPTPAECRRGVSGAYYGALNVVVEFLKTKARLEPLRSSEKHSAAKLSLIECRHAGAKQLGMKLDSLHTERKKADYEMADPHPERQVAVKAACAVSNTIIAGLDGFAAADLTSIISGMQAWAKNPASKLKTT